MHPYTAPRTVTALAALRQYAQTHSERRALNWAIAQITNRTEQQGTSMSIGRNKVNTVPGAVTVQWANGKTQYRAATSNGRFGPLVGFHVEASKDPDFDALMRELSIPQIEIKHMRQGAQPVIAGHWFLGEELRFFPISSGPVAPTVAGSLAGPNARETAEAGIGLRWGDGERSRLAIRAYINLTGPDVLVQLSVRSRMTDELLKALVDHVRVCEAADQLIDRERHPEVVSLHEIALPLGPGEEREFGRGDTATVTPLKSMHPEGEIEAAYLRQVWRPDAVHAAALRAWDGVVAWARDFAQGRTDDQHGEPHREPEQPEEVPF